MHFWNLKNFVTLPASARKRKIWIQKPFNYPLTRAVYPEIVIKKTRVKTYNHLKTFQLARICTSAALEKPALILTIRISL